MDLKEMAQNVKIRFILKTFREQLKKDTEKQIVDDLLSEDEERQRAAFQKLKGQYFLSTNERFLLGFCYLHALGRKSHNYKKAMEIFNGIVMKCPFAQYELAEIYRKGIYVEFQKKGKPDHFYERVDEKKAKELYFLATGRDHAGAEYALTRLYEKANPADYNKIVEGYSKAARLANPDIGFPEAQFKLGIIYLKGRGAPEDVKSQVEGRYVLQDLKKAFDCFEKAVNQGHVKSRYYLAMMLIEGRGAPINYHRACELLQPLATPNGYAKAQCQLGIMYAEALGVPQDDKKATELFQLSAKQGNVEAEWRLKWRRQYGVGIERDEKTVVEDQEAALRKLTSETQIKLTPEAQCKLANQYERVAKDDKKAAELFRLAAEEKCAEAQYRLGRMKEEGRGGLEKNDKEAFELYRLAANQGHPEARYRLGLMHENNHDFKEAREIYELAANQGHLDAELRLAHAISLGEFLHSPDEYRALPFYEMAALRGHGPSQFKIAKAYDEGVWCFGDNGKKAFKFYEMAANQGMVEAQLKLVDKYKKGKGVPKDLKKAREWLERAAATGDMNAACDLGTLLGDGLGGVKDEKRAYRLFQLAADRGSATALYNVALMMAQGRGVVEDVKQAIELLQKSRDDGCLKAKDLFDKIIAKHNELSKLMSEQKYEERKEVQSQALSQAQSQKQSKKPSAPILKIEKPNITVEVMLAIVYLGFSPVFVDQPGEVSALIFSIPKNEQRAFAIFEVLAQSNYLPAQYYLGKMCEEGRGVLRDDKQALEWYQRAADGGFLPAICAVGKMLEQGLGSRKYNQKVKSQKAFGAYYIAAKQGYAEAQYILGMRYREGSVGLGIKKEVKRSHELFHLAAEQDYFPALYLLAEIYEQGKEVVKDEKKARVLYLKALANTQVPNEIQAEINYRLAKMTLEGRGGNEDLKRAFELFDLASKKGHLRSQCQVALMVAEGFGVPREDKKACELLLPFAKPGGDAEAQCQLGIMYEEGRGVPPDQIKARELYQLAAFQGNAEAEWRLAWMYKFGRGNVNEGGIAKDEKTAFELFCSAAKKGHRGAQYHLAGLNKNETKINETKTNELELKEEVAETYYKLGIMHERVLKDDKQAFEFYRLASDRKHAKAQYLLGKMHAEGRGGLLKDLKEALRLYQLAVELGDPDAQFALGEMVENGVEVKQDDAAACQLYRSAIEQQHVGAAWRLGFMHQRGRGVVQDYKKSIELYELSAKHGDLEGCAHLAAMYAKGRGVPKNLTKACELYERAKRPWDASSCRGMMYERGLEGVNRDLKKALELYEAAAKENCEEAIYQMALMFEQGRGVEKDDKRAFELFLMAANKGHVESKYNIAMRYLEGRGVAKDALQAFEILQKLAQDGYPEAQDSLGLIYESGIPGIAGNAGNTSIPKSTKQAVELYLLAAAQHLPSAQYHLARMHEQGLGGLMQDEPKTVELLQAAASQGHRDAQFAIAERYREGRGVLRDARQAFINYQNAAEHGHMDAQYRVALMYEKGEGGAAQDDKMAFVFFERAVNQGHKLALFDLGWMYERGQGGVSKDEKKARELYELCIEHAKPEARKGAFCQLGCMLVEGRAGPKDEKRGLQLLRQAAKRGSVAAAIFRGRLYEKGQGVKKNEARAYKYYLAHQEYTQAKFYLGLMMGEGRGILQDSKKALELIQQAADAGNKSFVKAQRFIGVLVAKSRGNLNEMEVASLHEIELENIAIKIDYFLGLLYAEGDSGKFGIQKNEEKAREIFQALSKEGYAPAAYQLGKLAEKKRVKEDKEGEVKEGVPDFKTAYENYRLAADRGYAPALCRLGRIYEEGLGIIGVEQNHQTACRFYQLAADQEYAEAEYRLALKLERGEGIEKDEEKARDLFAGAATSGLANAQCKYGILLEEGRLVTQKLQEALEFYQKAADQNHPEAQYRLALFYSKGVVVDQDHKKAFEYFQLSASEGHQEARYHLGVLVAEGRVVRKDNKYAFVLFQTVVKQEQISQKQRPFNEAPYLVDARYRLAKFLEEGGYGVVRNEEQAFQLYEEIAGFHQEAQFRLAKMYQEGKGILRYSERGAFLSNAISKEDIENLEKVANTEVKAEKDEVKADKGETKANKDEVKVQKDETKSQNDHGEVKNQKDPQKNKKEVALAQAQTQSHLALCYSLGIGVPKNLNKAVEYFKLAVQNGETYCLLDLWHLYQIGSPEIAEEIDLADFAKECEKAIARNDKIKRDHDRSLIPNLLLAEICKILAEIYKPRILKEKDPSGKPKDQSGNPNMAGQKDDKSPSAFGIEPSPFKYLRYAERVKVLTKDEVFIQQLKIMTPLYDFKQLSEVVHTTALEPQTKLNLSIGVEENADCTVSLNPVEEEARSLEKQASQLVAEYAIGPVLKS